MRSKRPPPVKKQPIPATSPDLGHVETLAQFLATAGQLSDADREQIIDQAIVLIEGVFVHLPLKRAMHAVDPVQRLRLLQRRHKTLSERAFHDEMILIFTQLRDLHTNYVLPEPYRSRTAFVPFRIEAFGEGEDRKHLVTQVANGSDPHFERGVRVTHWNGVPIDRAVELNAEREAGSNLAARHARGLAAMTIRWMGMSQPPDEEDVTIRYEDLKDKPREIRFEWRVGTPALAASCVDPLEATGEVAQQLGIDAKTEAERRMLKALFARKAVDVERQLAESYKTLSVADMMAADVVPVAGFDPTKESFMPDAFKEFRTLPPPHDAIGYVRITTFNVQSHDDFIRIVQRLPQTGLIIDVRGNGGGLILAGERLLQLLTPRPIEPARVHFINTPLTLDLCSHPGNVFIGQWKDSIAQSIETGAPFSQGFTITPVQLCNNIGQVYQGPVLLITDALCYSTTDIFAAGFQDHAVGTILGVSENTGAGGANVWTHQLLRQLLPIPESPFKEIPKGAAFRVAVRRVTRVGMRNDVPIEDIGVTPDELYEMTERDLPEGNVDLLDHAAKLLATKTVYRLRAVPTQVAAMKVQLEIDAQSITRVDGYTNGRPRLTADVADGIATKEIEASAGDTIELRGFVGSDLVVSTRLHV